MSLLKVNEIQIFNGTTVTITATTTETSADLNVGADLDVTGALTLGTALAIAEGGTGATDAATARTNLDVDQAGTDNSTDVTLVTTSHDYLSITGQAVTLGPIDLAADVTGSLPYASISGTPTLATVATSGAYSDLSGTPTLGTAAAEDVGYFATSAQGTLADSAVQPGDDANTLGSGAATDGYVLTADGSGGTAWEQILAVQTNTTNTFSANQIISVADNTNAALRITQTGTGNALVVEDSTNPDSTPFVVDASGRIAVGHTAVVAGASLLTPQVQVVSNGVSGSSLSLNNFNSTDSSQSIFQFNKSGNNTLGSHTIVADAEALGQMQFSGSDGTGFIRAASISASVDGTPGTNDMPGRLVFSTTADGAASPTERMRIDSSGNVGIGTSSPLNKLHVSNGPTGITPDAAADEAFFERNSICGITLGSPNTLRCNIFFADPDSPSVGRLTYNHNDNSMQFWGSNTERMRIDSSGNVLIGYTSSNGSYKLQVNSQIFATSAIIATSDGRYKENVTSLDGALNLVAQLNPVQFTWKEHPVHEFDRTQPTVGFIAQEVKEVLKDTPYVNSIIKANECLVGEERDEEGNIITEGTNEEFLGIAEGNLIALLTKALQEANAKIDALETRIQALEV